MVVALRRLGVYSVLQAGSGEQAMTLLNNDGAVDIVLCDLGYPGLDCLEFLNCARQLGLVRAVVVLSDLPPPLHRALGQMTHFSGLKLLGALSPSAETRALQQVLARYNTHSLTVSPINVPTGALPSEEDVRRGLDLGEFRAYYQPKCVLGSGDDAGAEVLARWKHPVRGLLLPKDFMAAVLAYDLVDELFKQLLEQGLSLLSVLNRSHHTLGLAFNMYASQLQGNAITEHIHRSLKRYDLPGSSLTFELAESSLLDVRYGIQESLVHLRMMGCDLSIDDFGRGFSSLKSLCQLPFTQIKLDAEFAQSLQQPRSRAMIASTLGLASSLNMQLVIDGISDTDQCQTLVDLGCLLGQGTHYASPMTSHQLIGWLSKTRGMRPNRI
ncbi:EAL domain-containing response regulator [Pseudomonas sp. R76]|uniref:EAL domain-containing response regulator n=1 Tax=Pseudomonas sp. R76 TaxID=1573711 RepID=UPI00135C4E28|nr:EAL domain-containing protein [Pseudomonas sp. R76]